MPKQTFTHEFKLLKDAKDVGYICLNGAIAIQGTVSGPEAALGSGAKTDGEVEVALERKISESITGKAGIKGGPKEFEALVSAIKRGSKDDFAKTLGGMLGIETMFQGAKLHDNIGAEMGVQFARTPFVFKFSGFLSEDYVIKGAKVKLEGKVEGSFSVGPSNKIWVKLVQRLGSETIKRFLISAGGQLARVAGWLVSAGILQASAILAVAIAAAITFTKLTAWLVRNAHVEGVMQGLASWYITAYTARVFNRYRPKGSVPHATRYVPDAEKIKNKMISDGEADALSDARVWAARNGMVVTSTTNADEILLCYRNSLLSAAGGKESTAIDLLDKELKKAIKRKFKIRLPGTP